MKDVRKPFVFRYRAGTPQQKAADPPLVLDGLARLVADRVEDVRGFHPARCRDPIFTLWRRWELGGLVAASDEGSLSRRQGRAQGAGRCMTMRLAENPWDSKKFFA